MDATKRTQWLASGVLVVTALGGWGGLLGRVVWIQEHVTQEERERLARQYTAEIPLMPERGTIKFADGTPGGIVGANVQFVCGSGVHFECGGKLNPLSDAQLKEALGGG